MGDSKPNNTKKGLRK